MLGRSDYFEYQGLLFTLKDADTAAHTLSFIHPGFHFLGFLGVLHFNSMKGTEFEASLTTDAFLPVNGWPVAAGRHYFMNFAVV
jgi:hypothetical protein